MVSTAACYAFLLSFQFLQSCDGLLQQRLPISHGYSKHRLFCTGSNPVPKPSQPARSNMNEKMLERAKKLREEALKLENLEKVSDEVDESRTKSLREEFVSRFPIERLTANTSIFSLGAFTEGSSANVFTNGTYVSVLAVRDVDKKEQKLKLDKISGESLRSKRAITSLLDELQSLSAPAKTIDIPKLHSDDVMDTTKPTQKESYRPELNVDQSRVGNIPFAALDLMCDKDTRELFERALVNVTDANGVVRYELQSISKYEQNFPWLERMALRAISWMILEAEHNEIVQDEDFKYLQMAFLSSLADKTRLGVDELLEFSNATDVANMIGRENYQLRADYLKAAVTGQAPVLDDLIKQCGIDIVHYVDSKESNELFLWRAATVNRLISSDPQYVQERALLWNLLPATATATTTATTTSVATETELVPSSISLEKVAEIEEIGDVSSLLEKAFQTDEVTAVQGSVNQNAFLPTQAVSGTEQEGLNKTSTIPEVISEARLDELSDFVKPFWNDALVKSIESAVEDFGETTAEMLVIEYFDVASRKSGPVISREGAGRFQVEMLKDLFVVTSVKMSQGAVIFAGKYNTKTSAEFFEKLRTRYDASRMSEEVGFTVVMNDRILDLENGMEESALNQLLGRSPAVIVYPKEWTPSSTSSMTASARKTAASLTSSLAAMSSAAFAGSCLGMFDPASNFMATGIFPEDFLPLAFLPLTIQYTSMLAETIAGSQKGFNVTSVVVPSLTLFTFGSRSIFTSMPKNRNDVFDVAAVGVSVALISSLAALFFGLQITASATSDVVANYPSVSLALLNTNAIVTQFLSYQLPVAAQVTTEAAVTVGDTVLASSPAVHLHWLAIAGAVTFIANTLQLIPVETSAGTKLGLAALGRDNFAPVFVLSGLLRFLFVLSTIFRVSTSAIITTPRLLLDYFVTSLVLTEKDENVVAMDNLTELSEGRRIVLLGLFSLLFFALVPYEDIIHRLFTSIAGAYEYIRIIATTGSVPIENSLF